METIVNKQFELADTARNYIKNNPNYQLHSFENSISICFNYKNIPAQQLCTELYEKAKLMIGFGTFNNVQFVRLVTINSGNSNADILNIFEVLENFVASHRNLKQAEFFQQEESSPNSKGQSVFILLNLFKFINQKKKALFGCLGDYSTFLKNYNSKKSKLLQTANFIYFKVNFIHKFSQWLKTKSN